jgi:hypothetical protein
MKNKIKQVTIISDNRPPLFNNIRPLKKQNRSLKNGMLTLILLNMVAFFSAASKWQIQQVPKLCSAAARQK